MKKILILLCLFYFSGAITALAIPQCPEGTEYKAIEVEVNDCIYIVEICIKCGDAMSASWVQIWSITKEDQSCDPGMTFDEVLHEIKDYLSSEGFIRANCSNLIPDCPNGIEFMVVVPDCWYKYYLPNWGIVYGPCLDPNNFDNMTCFFRICFNGVEYVKTDYYYSHPQNCSCPSINESQVPDPVNPGESSGCFSAAEIPCP